MNYYSFKKIFKSFKHFLYWSILVVIIGCIFAQLLPISTDSLLVISFTNLFIGDAKDWFYWVMSWMLLLCFLFIITEESKDDFR